MTVDECDTPVYLRKVEHLRKALRRTYCMVNSKIILDLHCNPSQFPGYLVMKTSTGTPSTEREAVREPAACSNSSICLLTLWATPSTYAFTCTSSFFFFRMWRRCTLICVVFFRARYGTAKQYGCVYATIAEPVTKNKVIRTLNNSAERRQNTCSQTILFLWWT